MDNNFHIAIIGAGLSGLALALALHQQSISCTIYEAKDAPLNAGGGLVLTPNGLRVLEAIDTERSLRKEGFSYDKMYFQSGITGEVIETIDVGSIEKHGMKSLRVYRHTVLEHLLAKVREKSIPVQFGRKFSRVSVETDDAVTWQFTDGTEESASLLIGADGIYSAVRGYLAPDAKPVFGGIATVVAAIPTAQLGLPAGDLEDLNDPNNQYPFPSGILVPQASAFVSAPQTKNGDEIMIAVMKHFPEEPENGRWSSIDNNKEHLRKLFREDAEKFPQIVQNAVSTIPTEQLRIWPAYTIPHLENWVSIGAGTAGKGRVIILGDAAHALPPSGGQGVNQAFEDVFMFALVLGRLGKEVSDPQVLQSALKGWQRFRQSRIDIVLKLNKQMDIKRLPAAAQAEEGFDPTSVKASIVELFDELVRIDFLQALETCLDTPDEFKQQ